MPRECLNVGQLDFQSIRLFGGWGSWGMRGWGGGGGAREGHL